MSITRYRVQHKSFFFNASFSEFMIIIAREHVQSLFYFPQLPLPLSNVGASDTIFTHSLRPTPKARAQIYPPVSVWGRRVSNHPSTMR